jgi:hypothetical protein
VAEQNGKLESGDRPLKTGKGIVAAGAMLVAIVAGIFCGPGFVEPGLQGVRSI